MTRVRSLIEAQLEEFNQVHGTVLLGMHQRLETIEASARGLCERSAALLVKAESEVAAAVTKLNEDSASLSDCANRTTQLVRTWKDHQAAEVGKLDSALTTLRGRVDGFDADRAEFHEQVNKQSQAMQRFTTSVRQFQQRLGESLKAVQERTGNEIRCIQTVIEQIRVLSTQQAREQARLRRMLWIALAAAGSSMVVAVISLMRSWMN